MHTLKKVGSIEKKATDVTGRVPVQGNIGVQMCLSRSSILSP